MQWLRQLYGLCLSTYLWILYISQYPVAVYILGKTFYSHLAFLRELYVFVYCKFWLQVDSVDTVYSVYCYVHSNPRLRPTLPSKLKDNPFLISCLLVNSSLCLKIMLALSVGGGGKYPFFLFLFAQWPKEIMLRPEYFGYNREH